MFYSCYNSNHGELNYIDLKKETTINISCNDLKKYHLDTRNLNEIEEHQMLKLFKILKVADDEWKIDARVYGYIFEKNKRINFCMSRTIIDIEGKKYFVSDQLRDYILVLTRKK